jgi:uncharacterized OsmC-like protein
MSNLSAREPLERARRLFLERPSAARKPNAWATAVWRDGLRCEVTGPGAEKAVTDMPAPMGGDGTGANPGWLLRAAMASCTATAIAMRAAMAGIELSSLEVQVQSESDASGLLGVPGASTALGNLRMSIKIGAEGVDASTLRELAAVSEAHSAVSCTLRERPPIALEIAVVGAVAPQPA